MKDYEIEIVKDGNKQRALVWEIVKGPELAKAWVEGNCYKFSRNLVATYEYEDNAG